MYMAENSGALVGDAMPSGGQRFGKREEEEGVEDEGEGEGEERGEEEEFGVQKYLEKCSPLIPRLSSAWTSYGGKQRLNALT